MFSFGEHELFVQAENPEGSRLRNIQNWLTKYTGFSPPVFHGRGMLNYTFGLVPYRIPVYTVGKTLTKYYVQKINPSLRAFI